MSKVLIKDEFSRQYNALNNRVATLERVIRTLGPEESSFIGVPSGGKKEQSLVKKSELNYDTEWKTITGGGGEEPKATAPIKIVKNVISLEELGVATKYLAVHSVTEEKLAEALLGPIASHYGLRKLGTGELEALPGNTEVVLLKAEQTIIGKKTLENGPLLYKAFLRGESEEPSLGSELIKNKKFTEGWEVKEGWEIVAEKAVHKAGFEEPLVYTGITFEVGKLYRVSITTEGSSTALTFVTPQFAGNIGVGVYGNTTDIQIVEALAEGNTFEIIPSENWNGKLTGAISVKLITPSTPVATFQSKGATKSLEVRVPTEVNNTLIGVNSGRLLLGVKSVEQAQENLAIGSFAGQSLTIGRNNSLVGLGAGPLITSGLYNIAIGTSAASSITIQEAIIAIGYQALPELRSGNKNVGIGYKAGPKLIVGENNFLLGYEAWKELKEGNENVSIGFGTGGASTATRITLIGAGASAGINNLKEATAIGYLAIVEQSESIILGKVGHKVGIGTKKPEYILDVRGDISIGVLGSSFRIKEGSNAKMGVATLASGEKKVETTAVKTKSRIILTVQGGTLTHVGGVYVASREENKNFVIKSSNVLDESEVAWIIIDPA